jgi:creatinine amidohydrolase
VSEPGIEGEVRWQALRRQDVLAAAEQDAVVVQPMGTIEQHGAHLPLDTDAFTAEAVAVRAARAAPFPVLVAPTVWWGVSEYWMEFGGTIALRPEALVDLLTDIVGSIGRNGFRRVLLLNGHAGNAAAMHATAVRLLRSDVRVVGMNYWDPVRDLLRAKSEADHGMIGHAGEIETSLQLALRPEAVRRDLMPAEGDETGLPRSALPAAWAEVVVAPPDPAAESPTGVYGVARAARAEFGTEIVELASARLVEFLRVFRRLPPRGPLPGGRAR